VALKVLQLLSAPETETKELVQTLSSDPAFSAELLRFANSPLFGLAHQVKTVRSAVVVLGRERLRAITMTAAMSSFLSAPFRSRIFQRCWQHSLATALLANGLASVCEDQSPDEAYTAGLLHDAGKFALLVLHPKQYPVLLRTEWGDPLNCLEKEHKLLGMDHCQAGRWLLDDWGLPPEIIQPAFCHHDSPHAMHFNTVKMVNLACRLATTLGFDTMRTGADLTIQEIISLLPQEGLDYATLHPDRLREALTTKITSVTG
jgi:HD-like signal output (HDOD) protein